MPARLVLWLCLTVIREVLAVCCLLVILVIVEADLEVIVAVFGIVIVPLVVVLVVVLVVLQGARTAASHTPAGRGRMRGTEGVTPLTG
jgi:hypothetical protein